MSQIRITDLSFTYPGSSEMLFENVNLCLDSDWKLGFVGRNGRGKTSFLRLLCGELRGEGTISSQLDFSLFPFAVADKTQSSRSVVREAIAPYRAMEQVLGTADPMGDAYSRAFDSYMAADGYIIDELIEREISLLQVHVDVLDRPFDSLSGGERVKLLLAALFLRKNAFLLIDEPTNHLDEDGRTIVREYLAKKSGYILVSHDRALLNHCCDHILSLGKGCITLEQGNYDSFHENQSRKEAFERAKNESLKTQIGRLYDAARTREGWSLQLEKTKKGAADSGFIGHKAAKLMQLSKNIERRQQRAIDEKRELLTHVETAEPLKIMPEPYRTQRLMTLSKVAVDYGKGPLFAPIDLEINRGDRIRIKAKNGGGKTSLIRLMMGGDVPHTGELRRSADLLVSLVSQTTEHISGSLYDFADAAGVPRELLLSMLRKLDFSRERFEYPIESYSAGQKKKVLLAASLCSRSHLYIWDEPLNFIDILSREQIEHAIMDCDMTLVFVEHDEVFASRIATHTVEL